MPSNELFTLDANGNKQDADLHQGILDGIPPKDAAPLLERTRETALALGIPETVINVLYPTP